MAINNITDKPILFINGYSDLNCLQKLQIELLGHCFVFRTISRLINCVHLTTVCQFDCTQFKYVKSVFRLFISCFSSTYRNNAEVQIYTVKYLLVNVEPDYLSTNGNPK